jgi:protein SCO1/2
MIIRQVFLALLTLLLLGACQAEPAYTGTQWPTPQPAADFTLQSAAGPVSLSDLADKVVLLYFGYTSCPDICPATLADLARAVRELDDEAKQIQVVMVTVDPERDTPERLAEYVGHFHPSFIGLSGTPSEVGEMAAAYGVYIQRNPGTAATGYLVDHTARVFVIDRQGEYWLSFPFGMTSQEMAADLRNVLKRG